MSIDPAWNNIKNSELVASDLNKLPSFHDAYIERLLFESGDCNAGGQILPSLLVDIDFPIFQTNNGVAHTSHYIKTQIKFTGVTLAKLNGFTYDNCLYFIEITKNKESNLLFVKMDSSSNIESFECELSCDCIDVVKSVIKKNT